MKDRILLDCGFFVMKSKAVKKSTAKADQDEGKNIPVDPFASLAEPASAAKPATKKESAAKAVKPRARKTVKAKSTGVTAKVSVSKNAASPVKPISTRVSASPAAAAGAGPALSASAEPDSVKTELDRAAEIASSAPEVALSPVFKALAEPELPELERENRARLLMQSPTKLYFYWSVRENPYQLLRNAFGGDTGNYVLVLKLTDLRNDNEELHRCEPEGTWWFDVQQNGEYQAEVGFYAPGRPYFRVIYSNTVETPRRSPSTRTASDADWTMSATKFAEVLDVSGFSQDAFEVAIAGDDPEGAIDATYLAFSRLTGVRHADVESIEAEDMRRAMFSLASGSKLEELRWSISAELFAILQASADADKPGAAMSAIGEYFDVDETVFAGEQYGPIVYGASLIHFPKTRKSRRSVSRYAPLSSATLAIRQ